MRILGLAAVVAYGWWATSLRPFSGTATVAVVGAGVAAIVWGASRRAPRQPVTARRGTGVWALLAGALAAWQLAAYLQHPRSEHPTLSSLANAALEPDPVRALAFALWVAVAAAVAAR